MLHTQYYRPVALLGISTVMLIATSVYAKPFTVPEDPESFDDILKELNQKIPENLEEAMCGGWDFEVSVQEVYKDNANPTSTGMIARIKGLPGRDGEPLANIKSGKAKRIETGGVDGKGYQYPDDVCGLMTLCRPKDYPDIEEEFRVRQEAKFFCELPCQRPLGDIKPNESRDDGAKAECDNQEPENDENKVLYSCGGGEMRGPDDNPSFCEELKEEGPNGGLCQDMNEFIYPLWKKSVKCVSPLGIVTLYRYKKNKECGRVKDFASDPTKAPKPDPSKGGPSGNGWVFDGYYECCSDAPMGEQASCTTCTGEDCRAGSEYEVIKGEEWIDPIPFGVICPSTLPSKEDLKDPREYKSFFREYTASYKRAVYEGGGVPRDEEGAEREKIPVACYGIYEIEKPDEDDPSIMRNMEDAKITEILDKEKSCVIAAYYENDGDDPEDKRNFWEMKESQLGKGNYGLDTEGTLKDDPFDDPDRNENFNEDEDFWFPNLGGGFSMINDKVFLKQAKGDLTFALLGTDNARLRATPQLSKENDEWQALSSGALIRAFDDTIANEDEDRRSIVKWWQKLETEMHSRLTTPIVIRLLLPLPWSLDLDPLNPIYVQVLPEEDPEKGIRSQSIEVQLHAKEDILGDVLAFMEQALLLHIQEEPIPLIVPMGSPTEFRADAHAWQIWGDKMEEIGFGGEASEADKVADGLIKYADHIDEVRKLRGELARYAGRLLEEQSKIAKVLSSWLEENGRNYQDYMSDKLSLTERRDQWREIQNAYRKAHDETLFPWCRNARFTTPIYSLLDPWMPGRPDLDPAWDNDCGEEENEGGGGNEEEEKKTLPMFKEEYTPDIEWDFTAFHPVQEPVLLPVLKVTQVRLDTKRFAAPPFPPQGDMEYPVLADLPAIPTVFQEIIDHLPTVIVPGEGDDRAQMAPTMPPTEIDPTEYVILNGTTLYKGTTWQNPESFFIDNVKVTPNENSIKIDLFPYTDNSVKVGEGKLFLGGAKFTGLANVAGNDGADGNLSDGVCIKNSNTAGVSGNDEVIWSTDDLVTEYCLVTTMASDTFYMNYTIDSSPPEEDEIQCILDRVELLIAGKGKEDGEGEEEEGGKEDLKETSMLEEYEYFWKSIVIERCDAGETDGFCIKDDAEQDCINPHNADEDKPTLDPNPCVHFEADLRERFQEIGARPAIFLREDFESIGKFRDFVIDTPAGQSSAASAPSEYEDCDPDDWACEPLHPNEKMPRTGWQLQYDQPALQQEALDALRTRIREETGNASSAATADQFYYDLPPEELLPVFEIFPSIPLFGTGALPSSPSP